MESAMPTLTELKAMAYDQIAAMQTAQQRLNEINQQIAAKMLDSQQASPPSEPVKLEVVPND